MKAEGEMGYEPSLLGPDGTRDGYGDQQGFPHRLDHQGPLDGDRRPEDPKPDVRKLHAAYQVSEPGREAARRGHHRNSEATIPPDIRENSRVHREVVLDEIQSLITRYYPGQSAAEKKTKLDLLKAHFQASWTEMERLMPLSDLRAGYDTLHIELEGEKSKYSYVREIAPEMDDSIPDFEKAAE
jgi:hypothetical protein